MNGIEQHIRLINGYRRKTNVVKINGEWRTFAECGEMLGITKEAFGFRVKKHGAEKAMKIRSRKKVLDVIPTGARYVPKSD